MSSINRIMGVGLSAQQAQQIAGDVASGLTAAGSTSADALQLKAAFNQIATTTTGTGVILPGGTATADWCVVRNRGPQTLTVYPASSGTVDGGASDTLATTVGALYFAAGANTWVAAP